MDLCTLITLSDFNGIEIRDHFWKAMIQESPRESVKCQILSKGQGGIQGRPDYPCP
jgi:hypothetical protein